MRLLLDTATFIHAIDAPGRLSRRASSILRNPNNLLELSAVSISEIAIKAGLGKLRFSADVLRQAVADLDLRILPYTCEHAFSLFALSRHHHDPFDRQILAQALHEQIPIVTPDEIFRLYREVKVIW